MHTSKPFRTTNYWHIAQQRTNMRKTNGNSIYNICFASIIYFGYYLGQCCKISLTWAEQILRGARFKNLLGHLRTVLPRQENRRTNGLSQSANARDDRRARCNSQVAVTCCVWRPSSLNNVRRLSRRRFLVTLRLTYCANWPLTAAGVKIQSKTAGRCPQDLQLSHTNTNHTILPFSEGSRGIK